MFERWLDEGLTRLNRAKVPARVLETLVRDIPESTLFPEQARDRSSIGIYIHIPFCATKCSFCGYSVEYDRDADLKQAYAGAVATHLRRLAPRLRGHRLSWVSFGGGTPSSLTPSQMATILGGLEGYDRERELSISMEMRTDSLEDDDKLERFIDLGINRVCLGVQSFDDQVRRSFGLRLTGDRTYELLQRVRDSGVEYAFDVIWGGREQTHEDLDYTLDRVFELHPHQIDAYPLFPIEGTSQFRRFQDWEHQKLKRHQRVMCDHLLRRMKEAGYIRIDGVMFSRMKDLLEDPKGGFREASSLLVPETGHIIGVGQSAHSIYGGTFAANPYSTRKYVEMITQGRPLVYTGIRAPMVIAAFRGLIGALTRKSRKTLVREQRHRIPTARDLEVDFYHIRFWWHVFTGLRGWNALTNHVGYPIGNKNTRRMNASARYVTAEEFAKNQGTRARRMRSGSLPVVS